MDPTHAPTINPFQCQRPPRPAPPRPPIFDLYGSKNRSAVMEHVLDSPFGYSHLHKYYFRPTEAKVNAQLLLNLQQELSQVKGIQSSEMLLLNVIVGGIGSYEMILYSHLLQTNPSNIGKASQIRQSLQSSGASMQGLQTRRQRSDKLPKIIVEVVNKWQSTETQVSLVAKEVTRLRLAPKNYEVHPMHYLYETQVLLSELNSTFVCC